MSDRPKSSGGSRKTPIFVEPDQDEEDFVAAVDKCGQVARATASKIDKLANDIRAMLEANPSPLLARRG